jgi:uncharacterized protein YuzE
MNGKLSIWFDEEGDFLEFSISNKKGFFRDLGNEIFERVDEKGNVLGIAIFNMKKRKGKDEKISLPIKMQLAPLK